jgi:hypothetical protein
MPHSIIQTGSVARANDLSMWTEIQKRSLLPFVAMVFRLIYRGPLHPNAGSVEKQQIRRMLRPQLADLWSRPPLALHVHRGFRNAPNATPDAKHISLVENRGGFPFVALVHRRLFLVCHLDILFLRRRRTT